MAREDLDDSLIDHIDAKLKSDILKLYDQFKNVNNEGDLYDIKKDPIPLALNDIPDTLDLKGIKDKLKAQYDLNKGELMTAYPYIAQFKSYYENNKEDINEVHTEDLQDHAVHIASIMEPAADIISDAMIKNVDIYTLIMMFGTPKVSNGVFYGGQEHSEEIRNFLVDNGFKEIYRIKNDLYPCIKADLLPIVLEKFLIPKT